MLEIERKFLVRKEDFEALNLENGFYISQGYLLNEPSKSIRIRLKDDKAFLTLKFGTSTLSRREYEYEIPFNEGKELLAQCLETLEKIRYPLNHDGSLWEIDVFLGVNKGLVLAEIELKDAQEKFSKPDWLGLEVTEDPKYLNVNLIRAKP